MSSVVPEGWHESEICDFVNVGRGYAFKSSDYRSDGNPIVRVTNISEANGLNLLNDVVYLAKDRAKEFEPYLLRDNDFLLVMVGATVGKYAKVATKGKLLFLNQNMWRLSVIDAQTNWQKFAIYGLQKVVEQFLQTMQGSAREFLTQKEFGKASIFVPPLPEQKKIASTLTSVDEVIETTQKQIDKLQDLKKATMNELLTKGIGHTEFKDSELGKIPKSWEVVELGNSVKKPICYGIVQVGDFDSNGVKVIAIKYLGKINASHLHRSKKTIEEKYKRSRVISGDLLISIKGTIGRIDIVPDDFVGNISRDIARISLSSDHIPDIIQAYLESSVGKTNIAQTTVGTTRAELSIGRLVELKIPKIPLNEQVIIKQIYDSFNIEIATKFKKLSQTQSLKKSLMQDLLTGKVRVQVN